MVVRCLVEENFCNKGAIKISKKEYQIYLHSNHTLANYSFVGLLPHMALLRKKITVMSKYFMGKTERKFMNKFGQDNETNILNLPKSFGIFVAKFASFEHRQRTISSGRLEDDKPPTPIDTSLWTSTEPNRWQHYRGRGRNLGHLKWNHILAEKNQTIGNMELLLLGRLLGCTSFPYQWMGLRNGPVKIPSLIRLLLGVLGLALFPFSELTTPEIPYVEVGRDRPRKFLCTKVGRTWYVKLMQISDNCLTKSALESKSIKEGFIGSLLILD